MVVNGQEDKKGEGQIHNRLLVNMEGKKNDVDITFFCHLHGLVVLYILVCVCHEVGQSARQIQYGLEGGNK